MKQALLFTDDDYHGQGVLFEHAGQDDSPLFASVRDSEPSDAPEGDDAPADACDCKACRGTKLEVVCERTGAHPDCPTDRLGNRCTLEGKPARIIGRSFHYATIEPLDLEADPIRCCWDIVADVMDTGGNFTREDDDTDE